MDKVLIVKPSALFLLLRLVLMLFAVETVYGLCFALYLFYRDIAGIDRVFIYFLWGLQIVKFWVTLLVLGDLGGRYLNFRYYITGHHMLSEKGLINNQEKIYELNSLRKVSLEQDWLGKHCGYGTVRLTLGARGYAEKLVLRGVAEPRKVEEALNAYLGAYY